MYFTDCNAASGNQRRDQGLVGFNHVRFDFIRRRRAIPWDKEGWVRYVQAEVLVPECIPLEKVMRVVFVSEASRQEAERLWGNHSHPEFIVNPAYFENISPQGDATLNFSVLYAWYLTDSTIDRSNVEESRVHQSHFQKHEGGRITAVAHVHAFSGTWGSFIWDPGSHKFEGEFETSGDYWQ